MKTILLMICVATVVAIPSVALCKEKQEQQSNDVGRYQLFQGEYMFVNIKGEQHWSRALIKIDTVTGKMFICDQWQEDGKYENKTGQLIQRRTCKAFDEELVVPQ